MKKYKLQDNEIIDCLKTDEAKKLIGKKVYCFQYDNCLNTSKMKIGVLEKVLPKYKITCFVVNGENYPFIAEVEE